MVISGIYTTAVAWLSQGNVVVTAIAGIASAVGFKTWGWPRVKRLGHGCASFSRGVRAISQLGEMLPAIGHLAAMEKTLATIQKEVLPNGGSSMRDAVNLCRDIAMRTEETLALWVNSSRATWDAMGLFGVSEFDAEGELIYTNTTMLRWVNAPAHEMLGTGWINAITPADRERVRHEWQSCLDDERMFSCEFNLRRADGEEIPVLSTRTPVRKIASGPVEKWVGVIQRKGNH